MDQSGDYANIESPSSMITTNSDTSNQSASDTSSLIPEMHHIPKQLNTVTHRDTSGIGTSVTTFKHKNNLQLKLNIPISQAVPSPNFTSTKHDHAPQDYEAMSTTPLSGDEEHDFNTGHVPI